MSFEEILMKGKFFFPAYSHYGSNSTNIQCDKCFKNSLVISIGYLNRDLCLNCAENIAENLHRKINIFPQVPIPKKYITRMESIIYRPFDDSIHKEKKYYSDLVESKIKKIDDIIKELKDE
jgi:hypothetical protein